LGHERLVYPALGIEPDEKVVAAALPRVRVALDVLEAELADGREHIVGADPTLADFFLLPSLTTLSLTSEGDLMLKAKPRIAMWRARMEAMPSVVAVRQMVAPHIGKPLEHARQWVVSHRPKY
jgi:glutathione S-transferase